MKLHQINADDLATLEELLPELTFMLGEKLNETAIRIKCRRVKEILSNVRWSYGPPSEVEIIPGDPTTHGDDWKQ